MDNLTQSYTHVQEETLRKAVALLSETA